MGNDMEISIEEQQLTEFGWKSLIRLTMERNSSTWWRNFRNKKANLCSLSLSVLVVLFSCINGHLCQNSGM